jgi:uncharacterized protein (DUF58 family)
MIRPTRRAIVLFAMGLPLPWLALTLNPSLWPYAFDYSAVVLLIIGADAVTGLPRRAFKIEFHMPQTILIGDEVGLKLTIGAAGLRRPTAVDALVDFEGPGASRVAAMTVLDGGPKELTLVICPTRRGILRVLQISLLWRGPLALTERIRIFHVDQSATVLPNVRAAHSAALEFFARDASFGLKPQHEKGEGAEFEALREYVPGLDHRYIDWKHSARHRKLLCKEFRTERNHPVVLAFDTGHIMREPIDRLPRLDHNINCALFLAWIALRTGDLVGTYAFDGEVRQFVQPLRGVGAFHRIRQAAGTLEYRDDETNFTLGIGELISRLRRRTLVVLFTEFVDTTTAELLVDNVGRLIARHLVIFVTLRDPVMGYMAETLPKNGRDVARAVLSFEFMRDRAVVLERLKRLGVHCLDVPAGRLSPALLNRYLHIKQRGIL